MLGKNRYGQLGNNSTTDFHVHVMKQRVGAALLVKVWTRSRDEFNGKWMNMTFVREQRRALRNSIEMGDAGLVGR